MRAQHDIDEMLARHEARFGEVGPHDVPTGSKPAEDEDPLVRRAKILVQLSGGVVRTSWPLHARGWTEADRAERREWVRRLYGEQKLAVKRVAELLGDGVSHSTVGDDVTHLGIARGRGAPLGTGTVRQLRQKERRQEVARLAGLGLNGPEIANKLGCGTTTINNDIAVLGLDTSTHTRIARVADRQTVGIVGRAIEQLSAMAQLLLNQDGLDDLSLDEATAKDWERQCKIVARAIRRVRRTTKGEP